jgi:hypothetical protein
MEVTKEKAKIQFHKITYLDFQLKKDLAGSKMEVRTVKAVLKPISDTTNNHQ